jgi:hypothetical protein
LRIVGDENHPGFSAGEGQEDVVPERFGDTPELESFAAGKLPQDHTRPLQCPLRRGQDTPTTGVDAQHVPLELAAIGRAAGAGEELLAHDGAQVLEGCEEEMEALQSRVGRGVAKAVDEY